jgi:hypothetical protein
MCLEYINNKADVSFKIFPSGQQISVPSDGPNYAQWHISPGTKIEMEKVNQGIPDEPSQFSTHYDPVTFADFHFQDATTLNQDFIICHLHSQGP